MPIEKKPFVSYTLQEDKHEDTDLFFSVRANKHRLRSNKLGREYLKKLREIDAEEDR